MTHHLYKTKDNKLIFTRTLNLALKQRTVYEQWQSDFTNLLSAICSSRRFHSNYIAMQLVFDVANFFNTTTTCMRYRDGTNLLWRTGFKLFEGKFLKFVWGFKNIIWDIITGKAKSGSIVSEDSRGLLCPKWMLCGSFWSLLLLMLKTLNFDCWTVFHLENRKNI